MLQGDWSREGTREGTIKVVIGNTGIDTTNFKTGGITVCCLKDQRPGDQDKTVKYGTMAAKHYAKYIKNDNDKSNNIIIIDAKMTKGTSWTTVWDSFYNELKVIEAECPDIILLPSGLQEKDNDGNLLYLGHGSSHSRIRKKIDDMKTNSVIITCSCVQQTADKEDECVATDFPSGNVISVRCWDSEEAALKFGAGATVDFCVRREGEPDIKDIDMGAMEAAAVVTNILQMVKKHGGKSG